MFVPALSEHLRKRALAEGFQPHRKKVKKEAQGRTPQTESLFPQPLVREAISSQKGGMKGEHRRLYG
jgi:hypothetical protein